MTANDLLHAKFREYFHRDISYSGKLVEWFKTEKEFRQYFKKVLYFQKAVIEPLESSGMTKADSIVDIACGDGQMSLALFLNGYRNVTLFDMDSDRLHFGKRLIEHLLELPNAVTTINKSALEISGPYDVLISFQTVEHLSDTGNYSIASKRCQKAFLARINQITTKLIYINAPNFVFPIDGHDTGKWFFHFLPMSYRNYLIANRHVACSWAGIARPVSLAFLRRLLTNFRPKSNYYAFANMCDYIRNYPPFDYMGNEYQHYDADRLPLKKAVLNMVSKTLGQQAQNFLPVLSVVFERRTAN